MRHIPINDVLCSIYADLNGKACKSRLDRALLAVARMPPANRKDYIKLNGGTKWGPLKNHFTQKLGNKCWYTETELVGATPTIDHYRPKCDYWFLAFNADNFRVACSYANSPKNNPLHGCAGGKGDEFPLLDERNKARGAKRIKRERPIILDPCNEDDCKLVAFQPDGRPIIHPDFNNDAIAMQRIEKSMLLLNLDHPDFNSKREQLCNDIADDVRISEELHACTISRARVKKRLENRLSIEAPFSSAARFYLRLHRGREWVETMLTENK